MEELNNKYICDKCNYKTNLKSSYDKHLLSMLHLTGKRKTRKDKKADVYKCKICNYASYSEYNYKTHVLNNHEPIDERKKQFTFYCENCNFGTFIKSCYDLHLETQKHKNKNVH
jgi:hypothetical protein